MKFTFKDCVEYLQTATLLTAFFTGLLPICACVVSAKDSPQQQAHAKHEESVYAEIAKAPVQLLPEFAQRPTGNAADTHQQGRP